MSVKRTKIDKMRTGLAHLKHMLRISSSVAWQQRQVPLAVDLSEQTKEKKSFTNTFSSLDKYYL